MELRDYLRVLRLRKLLILACTLVGLAMAAISTLTATPQYAARAQLFVSSASDDAAVGTAYTGSLFVQARVKSYARIVNSPEVTRPVIDQLGLRTTPEALGAKIHADAPLDTVLLNITVTDSSPSLAQQVASAVASQFIRLVDSLERTDSSGRAVVKVSIVRAATLPTAPVSPNKKLNLALGMAAGLGVGVAAAVAREALDTRVKGADELQRELQLTTLGAVTFDPDVVKKPLIVQEDPHSVRAEAFRQLRTNLQFVDIDHQPRSIVVTSSIPQEGKTTTTCNLAITLAEAGVEVVLVDADLRRPHVGQYLGVETAAGLTDVLIGRTTLDDVLQPWGVTGRLKVLLSGPLPPNPSELLGSQAMAELLSRLEERALVLIDAPPLLPVTDAAVLSTAASGAVVVVSTRRTRREQVRQAVEALRAVDAHIFGCVLNMVPSRGPDSYRYGYGYTYKSTAKRKDRIAVTVDVTPATFRGSREMRPPSRAVASAEVPLAGESAGGQPTPADAVGADTPGPDRPDSSPPAYFVFLGGSGVGMTGIDTPNASPHADDGGEEATAAPTATAT